MVALVVSLVAAGIMLLVRTLRAGNSGPPNSLTSDWWLTHDSSGRLRPTSRVLSRDWWSTTMQLCTDDEFRRHFRMRRSTFHQLCASFDLPDIGYSRSQAKQTQPLRFDFCVRRLVFLPPHLPQCSCSCLLCCRGIGWIENDHKSRKSVRSLRYCCDFRPIDR
jgi:hypothetical protein